MDKKVVGMSIEVKGRGKVRIEAALNNGRSISVMHSLEDKAIAEAYLPGFKKYLMDKGIDISAFDELSEAELAEDATPDEEEHNTIELGHV